MVDPIADTATSAHDDVSIAVQRNIPASCHKHTSEKSRTVNQFVFYITSSSFYVLAGSSFIMAKTNTWYYSWFILLGLRINPDSIIHWS